jgi:hypothetical protein
MGHALRETMPPSLTLRRLPELDEGMRARAFDG